MTGQVSDTFSGSGNLGVTEVGGDTWLFPNAAAFTRSSGQAVTLAAPTSNPMATIDLACANIDASIPTSGGAECIYFRVSNQNNWWRLRHYVARTTTGIFGPEYNAGTVCYTDSGAQPGGNSYGGDSTHQYRWAISSTHCTAGGLNGYIATQYTQDLTGYTYTYNYYFYLEKCVGGVKTIVKQLNNAAVSVQNMRVVADGNVINAYKDNASTPILTTTDTFNQTATQHGMGLGPSDQSTGGIDSFDINALHPVAPTIGYPQNAASVQSDTPTLQGSVTVWAAGVKSKLEWQFSQDVTFVTGVIDTVEPDSLFRTSGLINFVLPVASKLSPGTWYTRVRQIASVTGELSDWSSINQFVIYHPPGAINLSPTAGKGLAYSSSVPLSWQFADPSVTDTQSGYEVIAERNDTGASIVDSEHIASSDQFYNLTVNTSLKDIMLRWSVKVWDQSETQGPPSPYNLFIISDPPVVAIISPEDGSTTGSSRPNVSWDFTPSHGRAQATYRVIFSLAGQSTPVFDSGVISGTAGSYTPANKVVLNGTDYDIQVIVTDTLDIVGTDTVTISAVYQAPEVPPVLIDTSVYETDGYVLISWAIEPDATFIRWEVYRRINGTTDWSLITSIPDATLTEYADYLVPAVDIYDYAIIQVVERFGEEVESDFPDTPFTVTVGPGGYWLIDPIDSNNNIPLTLVKEDSYKNAKEQAEIIVIGRGRHIDQGQISGVTGTLTAQLRDDDRGTARNKKFYFESLDQLGKPLYLRTPFGDVWYVSTGEVDISRIAGVGSSEFCDITVPYSQVF